jgi:hypothetical protein
MTPEAAPRLRIDARAEASLRAGGELEGPWQIPSELARRAFRLGARHVSITCRADGFVVRDDGPPLDAGTRALLERALDAGDATCHEALERLEAGDQAELRFLATLAGARITFPSASTLSVAGLRWDADGARRWLRSVGRFAGPALELDGEALPAHPTGALGQAEVASPPGRLWLCEDGEDGAIWVLRDRVVAAFLVVPGSLPFEAVLDLSASGARTAAELRERVAPLVESFADDAARLVCDAASGLGSFAPPAERRLRALVLEAARLPRWRGRALRAAVYPARERGRSLRLSLAELGSATAAGEDRRIATCEPHDAGRALFLSDAPVVLLEAAERARLTQELGLRFVPVPYAEGAPPRRPWWRRLVRSRPPAWNESHRG